MFCLDSIGQILFLVKCIDDFFLGGGVFFCNRQGSQNSILKIFLAFFKNSRFLKSLKVRKTS